MENSNTIYSKLLYSSKIPRLQDINSILEEGLIYDKWILRTDKERKNIKNGHHTV